MSQVLKERSGLERLFPGSLPVISGHRGLAQGGGGVVEPVDKLVELLARRFPRREECAGLFLHGAYVGGDLFGSGGGSEDHRRGLALRVGEFLTALPQTLVGEAEHAFEKAPVGASQKEPQGIGRNRLTIDVEKRVRIPLAAAELEAAALVLDEGSHHHVAIAVPEAEGRALGNAEERVFQGVARRRLPGLVGADNDVEILAAFGKLQEPVAEMPVAEEVEAANPHGRPPSRREMTPARSCWRSALAS